MNIIIKENEKSKLKVEEFYPGLYHNDIWILIVPKITCQSVGDKRTGLLINKNNERDTSIQILSILNNCGYVPFNGSIEFKE